MKLLVLDSVADVVLCSFAGWRFQRRRRIGKLPPKGQSLPLVNANTPSNGASWNQLQKSIDTTNAQGAGGDLSGMLNNLSAVKHGGKDK